jgi:hypothetical protein
MTHSRLCRAFVFATSLLAAPPALAQTSGSFTTLSYNIAGLLEPFSSGDPATHTPIISCLIRPYTLVNVQEDFNYHAALYDTCDDHGHRSPTTGGMGIGSGLNTLSHLSYIDWTRERWDSCNGVDCLTPKGFTMARVRLAEGVYVDVYNLHAQAQIESADLEARRDNILQLAAHIEWQSAGNAVIVMGDTNTRYTRQGDNIAELLKRGFTDVWVDRLRGGSPPAQGSAALTSCEPSATSADCEVVDKVLYRDNGFVGLRATDYLVEDQRFVDGNGADLSDHRPVAARWTFATASDWRLSDTMGGPHGDAFNDLGLLPAAPAVATVSLRAGRRVDQIGMTLSNGYVLSHGGGGGSPSAMTLATGEYLTSARLCTGQHDGHTRVFYAAFGTDRGRTLAGGSTTGSCTTYTAPSGWQIVGLHGRSGDEVDRLGLIYAPRSSVSGPASYVSLVNRASGLCLDVNGGEMAAGTDVLQWTCTGADWQKWSHDRRTGLLRSKQDPRFCLDNAGTFDNGATLMIWPCTGNANQRFDLDAAAGVLRMRTYPTQVIDGVGTTPGADVVTWSDWGGANQRWQLVP